MCRMAFETGWVRFHKPTEVRVARVRSAVHLRAGDTVAADDIDRWLRAYGVEATVFGDAFDACVFLLEHAEHVPDLILVGTDWLPADERQILDYLADTWPGAGFLLYGNGGMPISMPANSAAFVCRGQAALRAMLDESPDALWGKLHTDAEAGFVAAAGASTPIGKHVAGAPRAMLTKDELSALLDG